MYRSYCRVADHVIVTLGEKQGKQILFLRSIFKQQEILNSNHQKRHWMTLNLLNRDFRRVLFPVPFTIVGSTLIPQRVSLRHNLALYTYITVLQSTVGSIILKLHPLRQWQLAVYRAVKFTHCCSENSSTARASFTCFMWDNLSPLFRPAS